MNINFSKLILLTKNKSNTYRFLSFIFDSDIYLDQNGLEFTRIGNINLYLEDKENLRVGPHGFFAFSVDSQQDLKDLKSKIDLYCYREKTNLPEVLLKDKRLSFKDLDGNIWQVEVQTYIPNQISRNIIQEDVRNY